MTSPKAMDNSSQRPATFPRLVIIQIAISVVAIAVLIAVVLQISPLIEKKAELTAEIVDKNAQIAKHNARIEELGALKESLQNQIEQFADQLQEQETTSNIQSIKGQARSRRVTDSRTPSGRALYDYTLSVEVPAALKAKIRRVVYKFDHPSFSRSTLSSSNEANGFEVGYRGWGCLAVVKITIFLTDGTIQPIYFKMCQGLAPSRRDPHG